MAKKAELQSDRDAYEQCVAEARDAEGLGQWWKALDRAVASWPYIDGMMRFAQKYENQSFSRIEGIDIALRIAALTFDLGKIDELEHLLKSQKRIAKNTSADLAHEIKQARELLACAHRIWTFLEKQGELGSESLTKGHQVDVETWNRLSAHWVRMNLVVRATTGDSDRIVLRTQMNQRVSGKCPSCGVIGTASKSKLLEKRSCPRCNNQVHFVILSEGPRDN